MLFPSSAMERLVVTARMILHVDMDAFYAACELKEHPEWRGLPLVVGADPRQGRGRGVVLTATYEARKFGIRSGMPVSQAYRLCKDATFTTPNFGLYVRTSREVMPTIRSFADAFEQVGIDEAFLDVTAKARDWTRARDLAAELKAAVRDRHGVTCSVGVAPTKAVAKIASDFQKPDGLTVVEPGHVEAFLAPIPVNRIQGVGRKTNERLETLGIRTIGDLAAFPREQLKDLLGSWADYMWSVSHGVDDRPVQEWAGPPKSIGSETTFDEDTRDPEAVWDVVQGLIDEVHPQLEQEGLVYRTVGIKVRFEDFETHTAARSLRVYTRDKEPIVERTRALLREFLQDGRKIRLIGVRLSNLKFEKPRAVSLTRFG